MGGSAFLQAGHIDLWILVVGLFLPRLALFLAAFVFGDYPLNPLPIILNVLGWAFVPRLLIAYYVYVGAGAASVWFWIYLLLGIAGMLGESGYVHRRIVRRTTTVHPDGSRTTIEEEEV